MEQDKDISIIVPFFNEEESIPDLLKWIAQVMEKERFDYEIIMEAVTPLGRSSEKPLLQTNTSKVYHSGETMANQLPFIAASKKRQARL